MRPNPRAALVECGHLDGRGEGVDEGGKLARLSSLGPVAQLGQGDRAHADL